MKPKNAKTRRKTPTPSEAAATKRGSQVRAKRREMTRLKKKKIERGVGMEKKKNTTWFGRRITGHGK